MPRHRDSYRFFGVWFAFGLALCGLFLYGCLTPSPPPTPDIDHFDKFEHGFAFVVMGAWFGALFAGRSLRLFCILSLFGAITEVLQWTSGYRDGDPLDWMADSFGILIGLVCVRVGLMRWLVMLDRFVATTRNRT